MSKVLLSVGCDSYTADPEYGDLFGAEEDARRMYEALVTPTGGYDSSASKLLLSPNNAELDREIDVLFDLGQIDVLTIYFAGHGEMKGGFCYLCPSDVRYDRLSATALSLTALFNKLSELRPRQVNMVMDSCQSGGAMLDMGNLLKPENITDFGSPSISFLAACAPDQFANEDDKGGVATSALMKYLTGDEMLRDDRPYLDLVELGRAVSAEVDAAEDQTPVTWGLNLYGWGEFAKNPYFTATAPGSLRTPVSIAPSSAAGAAIERHSESLWRQYQSLADDPSYRDLSELLRKVCGELANSGASVVPFVRGIATSLRARAETSNDLLAESNVIACCAVALVPFGEDGDARALVRELLLERRSVDARIRETLRESLAADRFALLDPSATMGDFFYLPIRVSRTLGWLSSGVLTDLLLGTTEEGTKRETAELAGVVASVYRGSLVSMSDEQAPHVYLFATACRAFVWEDLAREVLRPYFDSLESVKGMVARANLEPEDAAAYVLLRTVGGLPTDLRLLAGPSQLLPGLLLSGAHLGMAGEWNRRLTAFDGRYMDFFLPSDYGDFGAMSIPNGTNYDPQLGHGIWTLRHLVDWFEDNHKPTIKRNRTIRFAETKAACVLAAYLLPDRMPYFVESELPNTLSSPATS